MNVICMFAGTYPECSNCEHSKLHEQFDECEGGECEITNCHGLTDWQSGKCISEEDKNGFDLAKIMLDEYLQKEEYSEGTVVYVSESHYSLVLEKVTGGDPDTIAVEID